MKDKRCPCINKKGKGERCKNNRMGEFVACRVHMDEAHRGAWPR